MKAMTTAQICEAVGGTLHGGGAVPITEVSTDSRAIRPGAWFVPIRGERFDGHDYIDKALDAGAAGCFFARPLAAFRPDKCYIEVPDTKTALRDLAAKYREQFTLPMIQITGSTGKTTLKEMIASVLSQRFRTLKTKGNLNGDIGTPLILLELTPEHQAAVIETGMDNYGQIRYLGRAVRPDIAAIINIGVTHLEHFGPNATRRNILEAKSEIFENLRPGGLAVLNGDDDMLNTLDLPFETLRCGLSGNCNVRVTDVEDLGVEGVRCVVGTAKAAYRLSIPAPGVHMVYAAAMAAAIGERLGLTAEEIVQGVAAYRPAGERMRVEHLSGDRIMLNDSYNASPTSVAAALRILSSVACHRRIAMLGDMKELGTAAPSGHQEMGRLVGELGIDALLAVGPLCGDYMVEAARAAGCPDVRWYENRDAAKEDLISLFGPGDCLLLKASHFSGRFDLMADYLRDTFS